MIVLYTGGQKSGKSLLAEHKTLGLAKKKPYYLATAEVFDDEFQARVDRHLVQRGDAFTTIEEPCKLYEAISTCDDAILIDCLTVWINNMIYYMQEDLIASEIDKLLTCGKDIVMVINEVGCGIIPGDKLSRKFADLSGQVAQQVAQSADEVHFCSAGLSLRMK